MTDQMATDTNASAHSGDGDPIGTRTIGTVNWLGLQTLYARECRRFLKVWTQTLGAPAVTTILFMVIFMVAFGSDRQPVAGFTYAEFLGPGLIMMAVVQNAFANTSSSLIISKVQGNIVDTLMPPLNSLELTIGYTAGGVTRGVLVGLTVGVVFWIMPMTEIGVVHWWAIAYFAVTASAMLSFIGILTGVWADKFDNAAAVQNFIIAPLSLLSGTFYSIERLAPEWQAFSSVNPFFYVIDGFRYGSIGRADSDITVAVLYTLGLNIVLAFLVFRMFKSGYKLKA